MISCKSCKWFYLTFCVLNNIVSYTQSHVSSYRREEVKSAREVYIFAKSPSELKEFFWRNASYLVLNFVPPYSTPPPRACMRRVMFFVYCVTFIVLMRFLTKMNEWMRNTFLRRKWTKSIFLQFMKIDWLWCLVFLHALLTAFHS